MPLPIPADAVAGGDSMTGLAKTLYDLYAWSARLSVELNDETEVNVRKAGQLAFKIGPRLAKFMAKVDSPRKRRAVFEYFANNGVDDWAGPAAMVADFVTLRDALVVWRAYVDASLAETKNSGATKSIFADDPNEAGQYVEQQVAFTVPKTAAHAAAIATVRAVFE